MKTKRILLAVMAMLLPLTVIADSSGTCGKEGNSVSWYYSSETQTLTISGNGYMENYPYYINFGGDFYESVYAPWNHLQGEIVNIIIENGVFNIGNDSFSGCTALTSVTIPQSVTSIGQSAFSGCTALTSVTIPQSVTSIGQSAFSGCTGLISVTIPQSVTSIGSSAFSGCTGLTSIKVEEDNTVYDSREGCNAIVKTADNVIVAGCKSTIIPNGVTSIGQSAFSGCTALTSVTIPQSVTSIEDYAFSDCTALTSVAIPQSVTYLGIGARYCFKNQTFWIKSEAF